MVRVRIVCRNFERLNGYSGAGVDNGVGVGDGALAIDGYAVKGNLPVTLLFDLGVCERAGVEGRVGTSDRQLSTR